MNQNLFDTETRFTIVEGKNVKIKKCMGDEMDNIKCLLFDCMETLIDMREIPSSKEYALWAFEGSGNEMYWNNFEEFFKDYEYAKNILSEKFSDYTEYDMGERLKLVAKNKIPENDDRFENMIRSFLERYWERYRSKCYIRDEVKTVLLNLSKKYKLGVVSNFKVYGGIEELLKIAGISELFEIKIISVNVGWRKPSQNIYNFAKEKTGLNVTEILFIGDDFECDYIGPKKSGMKSILLDRHDNFVEITDRIKDFNQLEELLIK